MLRVQITEILSLRDKKKFIEKRLRAVKERQVRFATFLVTELIATAPRLTGRYQSSWTATLDKPVNLSEVPKKTKVIDSIHPSMSRQLGRISKYAKSKSGLRRVFVSNPLHYWIYLEYGTARSSNLHVGKIRHAINRAKTAARIKSKESGELGYGPNQTKVVTVIT